MIKIMIYNQYMDYKQIANLLAHQKHQLGMSEAYIGKTAHVSQPTVHRILSGLHDRAAWNDIVAIGKVLGVSFSALVVPAEDQIEARAEKIAKSIARKVEATSQLEGQGLSDRGQERLSRQTVHELIAGPRGKLWQA